MNPHRLLRPTSLLWILLAAPAVMAAQQPLQSVTGVVRDTAGAAVSGADVLVGSRRTTTGPSGTFRVDSLRPGQYPITIRLVGFRPVHSRVIVVATEPTEMEYFLVAAPFLLDPIVVESRRTGIYGAVGDTSYKAAVGARVQVAGLNGGEVLTDSMGRFAFPEADRGMYMVRVTYPGYSERRFSVEVRKGEGRELGVLLTRATESPSRIDAAAVEDLGHRLAVGLSQERITTTELQRSGSLGLCDVPKVKSGLRNMAGNSLTVILNGVTVMRDFDVASLCSWRADEVELVEWNADICRDRTGTVAMLMGTWCGNSGVRSVPRSMVPGGGQVRTQGSSSAYVVIWEKR